MTTSATKLKYLFRAEFSDGTLVSQPEDDAPRIASRGSSFTDVLELQAQGKKLTSFQLLSADDEDGLLDAYSVDLVDGHFEANGHVLWLGDEIPPPSSELKLIYFRDVRRDFDQALNAIGVAIRYRIGWEAQVDGRSLRQTMGVF